MTAPALLLLAHGTEDPAGQATWDRLASALDRALPGVEVRLAYAGVASPSLPDVLVELPDPGLVGVLLDRLAEAGAEPGDTVLLAAAGSTDPVAQDDLRTAAALLTARVGHEVPVGYIAGGEPRVASVVEASAARGPRAVIATWLLAPGAFHRWLSSAGAALVAEPLGDHPDVVGVAVARYRSAVGA